MSGTPVVAGQAPAHLADHISLVSDTGRRLLGVRCVVSCTNSSFGDRSLDVAGSHVLNGLPLSLRQDVRLISCEQLKPLLQTFLFGS